MTPCFNDWKRFCAALREIASGEDGRPLTSLDAQKRAQEVLTDCGYSWSGNVTATAVRPTSPVPAVNDFLSSTEISSGVAGFPVICACKWLARPQASSVFLQPCTPRATTVHSLDVL